jgi:anti-sigma regulatory factor (Ser/Thr protein kinase)
LAEQMNLPIKLQVENTVEIVQRKTISLPDDLTVLGLGCAPKKTQPERLQVNLIEPSVAGEALLFSLSILNEVPELRRLRSEIERTLRGTPANSIIPNVNLAIDEATQNIIRHAFPEDMAGQIEISGYISDDLLHISLTDSAPLVDLSQVKPRELDQLREGGLGTHFIMQVTETANWWHDDGQNRLDLTFKI